MVKKNKYVTHKEFTSTLENIKKLAVATLRFSESATEHAKLSADLSDLVANISKILIRAINITAFLIWAILFLYWYLFFQDYTKILISHILSFFEIGLSWWFGLSEGWQMFYASIPTGILIGVIINILSSFIKEKYIRSILK